MPKTISINDDECSINITGYDLKSARDMRKIELLKKEFAFYLITVNGKLL